MAESEIRRRRRQLDTLKAMHERAREDGDVERVARIESSAMETQARIEELQAQSSESGGEPSRRRRG